MTVPIGELAARTGCKVQTVRYYEQIGLMPEPVRTKGNQRRYGSRHLERLAFIRHSRQLGFSLQTIRELLSLADDPGRSCAAAEAPLAPHTPLVQLRGRQNAFRPRPVNASISTFAF
ncbi:MAG: MerR family transcriptional regulator [Methyloceanibacter sp.]|nr:MerR family transcriptional regulator [Methyloceanibacter sp.]